MDSRPNWDLLAHAASLDEVKKDGFSAIFTSIFQAHLPNRRSHRSMLICLRIWRVESW